MVLEAYFSAYKNYKESQLFNRYIHNKMIEPLLKNLDKNFNVDVIGNSVLGKPIYAVKIGNGKKRILLWSQMHGNESTTTKAIFDVFNIFKDNQNQYTEILNRCTFLFIPILNPDGSEAYTRLNASGIDLNRDAKSLTQPESEALRNQFNTFKPHFCFNLHGQRTIFSAGKANNVATLSFLSPAEDVSRSITTTRKQAMEIIAAVNSQMQHIIPNQIGRYDDTYNENCVGDTFQSLSVPTILYEAGHFKNDYARETTRQLIFQSLLTAFQYIASKDVVGNHYQSYFNIPQNQKCFFDIIIRNAKTNTRGKKVDLGFQYREELDDNRIIFKPVLEKIEKLDDYFGHAEYDANSSVVLGPDFKQLKVGFENDFVLVDNEKYSLLISES